MPRFMRDPSYPDARNGSTMPGVVRLCFAPLAAFVSALGVSALGAGAGGCGGPTYPSVDCHQAVWVRDARADDDVRVIGSWDGWKTPGVAADPAQAGWAMALLTLPAGEYGYQIVVNGAPRADPFQPLTTFHGEQEVSLLVANDCAVPALRIDAAQADATGALTLSGAFLARDGGPMLAPATVRVTIDDHPSSAAHVSATPATGAFTVTASGLAPGKHAVGVEAADAAGHAAPAARASVWVKPAAETWADGVLYQIVIDRFRGDGGDALSPPATPGTRAGGTLAGVTAEIERGTFEALGVSALWLSPVYTNPDAFRTGRDGHPSQGYHGYWPVAEREVDPHLGGEAALDALMASAHAHGLRVLFDLVPNHVYETNPRYTAHEHDGLFDDAPGHCVCGDPGCDWGAHILSCWFTPYLPDVRWQSDRSMHLGMEDALFWMRRFDADGVRIDAVPMMPRAATRRIVRAMRDSVAPRALFSVGEVFTGPGLSGIDTIKFFLGPDGLDSAFDFPLMWSLRDTIAGDRAGFDGVESTLAATEDALRGSGAVLARMLGNHDTSRFASESNGDGGNDAWAHPPPQPTSPAVYAKQRMALALTFTLPGMPVIYYGDEVALGGASDPDSRRVMPAPGALSADQQETLAFTRRLGALRRCLPALRTGARVPIWADADTYAFARVPEDSQGGDPAVVLFSKAAGATSVTLPGGVVPAGAYVDALTGAAVTLAGGDSIPLDPMTVKLLIPSSSPCRVMSP
jgi:glycosidase